MVGKQQGSRYFFAFCGKNVALPNDVSSAWRPLLAPVFLATISGMYQLQWLDRFTHALPDGYLTNRY
jgi:hypothetical protein